MSERAKMFEVADEALIVKKTSLTPVSSVGKVLVVVEIDGCVTRMSDGYWYPNFCLQNPPDGVISPGEVQKMMSSEHWEMYMNEKTKNAALTLEVERLRKVLEAKR